MSPYVSATANVTGTASMRMAVPLVCSVCLYSRCTSCSTTCMPVLTRPQTVKLKAQSSCLPSEMKKSPFVLAAPLIAATSPLLIVREGSTGREQSRIPGSWPCSSAYGGPSGSDGGGTASLRTNWHAEHVSVRTLRMREVTVAGADGENAMVIFPAAVSSSRLRGECERCGGDMWSGGMSKGWERRVGAKCGGGW